MVSVALEDALAGGVVTGLTAAEDSVVVVVTTEEVGLVGTGTTGVTVVEVVTVLSKLGELFGAGGGGGELAAVVGTGAADDGELTAVDKLELVNTIAKDGGGTSGLVAYADERTVTAFVVCADDNTDSAEVCADDSTDTALVVLYIGADEGQGVVVDVD